MNREIKFRAFDDGKMLTMPIDTNFELSMFFGFLRDDAIIMQYTGLKDRNGKEIYEGDIVETDGSMSFNNYESDEGAKREIFVLPTGFCGVRLSNEFDKKHPSSAHIWQNYDLWNIQKSLNIIGNIYETPQLLNP